MSPTGNTATYDPQPVTTAPEDWSQTPQGQFRLGLLGGLALGGVPLAGLGEQSLDAGHVLPYRSGDFRHGLAIGQIFGGLASLLLGAAGEVGGGMLCSTGLGAVIGVPAMSVSDALIAGGLGNMAAGVLALATGSGSSPSATPVTRAGAGGTPSRSAVMDKAQLPHRGGLARYVPPKSWNATEPLPRGPQNGYMDVHGNEWIRGPSRTAGQPFEWDVQLPDGTHLNVSLDGEITHGLNLNGKLSWP